MIKKIIAFIILGVFVTWLYIPTLGNFFQQDEWWGFAEYYLVDNGNYLKYILSSFIPDPGHYLPLFKVVLGTSFELFYFDYWKWALVSIIWHIANSLLVYLLAKDIFKNNLYAYLVSFLFAIFASGHQATAWVVTNGATQGATTLVILSLIYFLKSKLFSSVLMLFLSMLFKEISIGMFAFFPIIIVYRNYIENKKLFDKRILYYVVPAFLYIIFRYLTFLGLLSDVRGQVITESQTINEIAFNIATFPIKGISQTVIPTYIYLEGSKYIAGRLPDSIAGTPGTTVYDNFYLKYVFGALNLFVFGVIAVVTLFFFKTNKRMLLIAIFSLLFVGINSLIYALSPGRSGFVPIIDSRNLYLPSIGIAFFFVSVFASIKNHFIKLVLFVLIITMNIVVTKLEINNISKVAEDRAEILNQINSDNIKLNNKHIFYIESDTSYYGLPYEIRTLPFQSGFGQTLMVWFERSERFPTEFFDKAYLWPIDSQGYKEVDGRGFGYFREFDLLSETVKEYNLPADVVVAYSWDSKLRKLSNTTQEIRRKLTK